MALFNPADRRFVAVLSQLINCNPFLPRWTELEQQALGPEFTPAPRGYAWGGEWTLDLPHANEVAIERRVEHLAEQTRQRLADGGKATETEWRSYEELALFCLYLRHAGGFDRMILPVAGNESETPDVAVMWRTFLADFERFFTRLARGFPTNYRPEHLFAWFFQLRRAFCHIYNNLVGTSQPTTRLRGAIWQSIFTHDMRRWSRTLYDRMSGFPTLITGPSGTGKELVARAVGLSRYLPFDPERKRFILAPKGKLTETDFTRSFYPLNLSALAPTLIESELFGHKKGSFSGAIADRTGWLEECDHYGKYGTVFLDEIGELDAGIQVKLLRVLQTGRFQKLGASDDLEFRGKIIAATNRDLAAEMRAGRFREDFYYRLCADRITTPSLREQLADAPGDLHDMLRFIARKEIGEREAESLAAEVADWIGKNLGRYYPWPGNFRELEQCVRNVMIRQAYEPVPTRAGSDDPRQELAAAMIEGTLTAEELERRYFTLVYAQSGNYQETARRLKCNWRTLRSKIDRAFLQQLTRKP
jgi:transcriptional regulator with AAA-type ATPase domain